MKDRIQFIDVTHSHSWLIAARFPEARDAKIQPTLFAAVDTAEQNRVVGLALVVSPIWSESCAYRFALDIPNSQNEDGIERLLLEHIIAVAKQHRAPALRNWRPVRLPEAHRLMQAFGFEPIRSTVTHEFLLATAYQIFHAEIERLYASGKIRAGVCCQQYEEGEARQISSLCRAEFGALTYGHLEAIGEYPAPRKDVSFARSFWIDGKLIGAWGVAVQDEIAVFDPLLIARNWRNTWAFTYIVHSVLQNLVHHQVGYGRAAVHQDNRKVMAVMSRINASVVSTDTLYELKPIAANNPIAEQP